MHQNFQTSINDCLLSSELCGHHVLFFRQLQDTNTYRLLSWHTLYATVFECCCFFFALPVKTLYCTMPGIEKCQQPSQLLCLGWCSGTILTDSRLSCCFFSVLNCHDLCTFFKHCKDYHSSAFATWKMFNDNWNKVPTFHTNVTVESINGQEHTVCEIVFLPLSATESEV